MHDAWFAALAIESGCEWVTADCDYGIVAYAGLDAKDLTFLDVRQ